MKQFIRNIVVLIFVFLISENSFAQTHTYSTFVDWQSTNQNMWGPNGSPFNINYTTTLFNIYYDTTMSIGYMQPVIGGQVGAMFNIDTWLEVGSYFSMTGFTTGWLDVYYPCRIDITFPDNYTWNPGEWVTINSDYEVLPGWGLDSHFPQAGIIDFGVLFGYGLDIDAEVCVISCDTFNIMNINVPTDTFHIFYINGQTGEVIYPCMQGGSFGFCHDTILPIVFNNFAGTGLSGQITIPYIETTDHLDISDPCHQAIIANGDTTYATFDLDLVQFLSFIAGFLPPPQGPAIQQFLSMLNGTYNVGGGITIDYSLLTADLNFSSTMQQDLTFSPTVWSNLSFPTPMEYYVSEPNNANAVIDSGYTDTISFPACDDLHIHWPCFDWPSMDVGINHSISPTITNHTWDSLAFEFALTALEFTINIPIPVLAPTTMPEFCIPLSGDSAETPSGITDSLMVEERNRQNRGRDYFCSGPIDVPGTDTSLIHLMGLKWSYHIGPLVNVSYPLGYIPITWYNNTWDMAGFQDTTIAPTTMIPNPQMEITAIGSTDIWCAGDSSGTMFIQIQYGDAPYTYEWSDGTIHNFNFQTDSLLNVPAGNYTVTVTDANGCSLDTSFTLVELDPPIIIDLTGTNVLCRGDSTGTISANVSGGTPNYTYQWSPMGGTTIFANQVPAGFYTFEVTDAVGCVETDTITIIEPDSAIILQIDSFANILCNGGNNGYIDLTALGGTPPYSYLWSNGQTSQDIGNLMAGPYSVTVTDANGCTETISQLLSEPQALSITNIIHQVSCYGGNDGNVDITVSGGTLPYYYLWSNGATTEDIDSLYTGDYTVTVTDAHNCQISATFNVPQPYAPLTATISGVDILCHGESTGSVDLEPTGGTVPYTYTWNSGATTQDLTNVPAGTYQVTITDVMGCTYETGITLTEPATSLNVTAEITDVRCFGEDNGVISITASEGIPNYTYLWNTGYNGTIANGLIEGYYSVTTTDDHGCQFILDSLYVNEPTQLIADVSNDQTICVGQEASVWVAATGGTYPYSYLWNNGLTVDTLPISPNATTIYSVVVSDAHGCQTVPMTTTVSVNPPITGNLFVTEDSVCPGEPVLLDVWNTTGGNGNYIYSIDSQIVTLPYPYIPNASGTVTITVNDDCGTPPLNLDTFIYVYPTPTILFMANNLSGCPPLTVIFHINNFIQGTIYTWNFGDQSALQSTYSQDITHNYNTSGTYDVTVSVKTENGCDAETTVPDFISVYEIPEAKFITDPGVIESFRPEIHFINLSSGATSYFWSFGDDDSSSAESPIHQYDNYMIEGYTVILTVENQYGCSDTALKYLDVLDFFTFWAPTAFSPNGDYHNDIFLCKGMNIDNETFDLRVYDRWGEVIFESNDINFGWDGIAKDSRPAPAGAYAWIATFRDKKGVEHSRSGIVTLIR